MIQCLQFLPQLKASEWESEWKWKESESGLVLENAKVLRVTVANNSGWCEIGKLGDSELNDAGVEEVGV